MIKEYADAKHDRMRALRIFRSAVRDGLEPDEDIIRATSDSDYCDRKAEKMRMKAEIIKNLYL